MIKTLIHGRWFSFSANVRRRKRWRHANFLDL